jgi:hypothetical protein
MLGTPSKPAGRDRPAAGGALWLEMEGYTWIGLVGTSIGWALSCTATSHGRAIRAGAPLLHMSTYYGDVVACGVATNRVWESLEGHVSLAELRQYLVARGADSIPSQTGGRRMLAVIAKYDETFLPDLPEDFVRQVRRQEVGCEARELPCGHYYLGDAPFSYLAFR